MPSSGNVEGILVNKGIIFSTFKIVKVVEHEQCERYGVSQP